MLCNLLYVGFTKYFDFCQSECVPLMNFISDFRLFILFLSFGIFDVFSSTSISAVILSD